MFEIVGGIILAFVAILVLALIAAEGPFLIGAVRAAYNGFRGGLSR